VARSPDAALEAVSDDPDRFPRGPPAGWPWSPRWRRLRRGVDGAEGWDPVPAAAAGRPRQGDDSRRNAVMSPRVTAPARRVIGSGRSALRFGHEPQPGYQPVVREHLERAPLRCVELQCRRAGRSVDRPFPGTAPGHRRNSQQHPHDTVPARRPTHRAPLAVDQHRHRPVPFPALRRPAVRPVDEDVRRGYRQFRTGESRRSRGRTPAAAAGASWAAHQVQDGRSCAGQDERLKGGTAT
jgi:hypothetical protein